MIREKDSVALVPKIPANHPLRYLPPIHLPYILSLLRTQALSDRLQCSYLGRPRVADVIVGAGPGARKVELQRGNAHVDRAVPEDDLLLRSAVDLEHSGVPLVNFSLLLGGQSVEIAELVVSREYDSTADCLFTYDSSVPVDS